MKEEKETIINDWEELYQNQEVNTMPWYSKALDTDIKNAISKYNINKKDTTALDLGTGPGTQAIELNKLGFKVTASDISETAIEKAKKLQNKKNINFIQDNILQSRITDAFDLVCDRGCFHIFEEPERKIYIDKIKALIKKGGYLLLKTFSYEEVVITDGPYRFKEEEIQKLFIKDFDIKEIKKTEFISANMDSNPKALLAVLQKR